MRGSVHLLLPHLLLPQLLLPQSLLPQLLTSPQPPWPQIRSELAEKELILLQKEQELLERDQTLIVLKEEVRG